MNKLNVAFEFSTQVGPVMNASSVRERDDFLRRAYLEQAFAFVQANEKGDTACADALYVKMTRICRECNHLNNGSVD